MPFGQAESGLLVPSGCSQFSSSGSPFSGISFCKSSVPSCHDLRSPFFADACVDTSARPHGVLSGFFVGVWPPLQVFWRRMSGRVTFLILVSLLLVGRMVRHICCVRLQRFVLIWVDAGNQVGWSVCLANLLPSVFSSTPGWRSQAENIFC